MENYLITGAILSFVIGISKELSLGKLIRINLLKKLYSKASIKEIESFEKNTKRDYNFNWKKK
ncbi:hypothetical protein [uncultured Algibacter sp.]|uniref:hypothetical protein n=1 Tax=uncultured Algibacter sp. TaxID=298659 RepID=UPI002613EE1D|nr:hypothetical protein [uncultured Algibacter sp.]